MSQALYRKYRSRTLDEVLGQDHVTGILRKALDKGHIAHAYLLTGPRGVGKTSVARILAHEINHLPYAEDSTYLDIIEIDAASNNGVDDIRSLREKARIAPVSAPKKIYIIDEVHMLSKPAFNALLKTLEEPPAHVVFILATTDADKLPSTILSRVQQFYFRPIPVDIMARQLQHIAQAEGFMVDEAAARLIAERSRGGFRDAISLLDQLSALASETEALTHDQVAAHLGLTSEETLDRLLEAYTSRDAAAAMGVLGQLETEGVDATVLSAQLLQLLRSRLVAQPELVSLIRELIEVGKHPHPDLKLLTIFANDPTPIKPKNVAQAAVVKPAITIEPAKLDPKKTPAPDAQKPRTKPEKTKKAAQQEAAPTVPTQEFSGELDWTKVLERAKDASAALFALLNKCDYTLNGNELTIYAGTKFAHKKLDDAKFRPQISEIIHTTADAELSITILDDKKPPKDEKLAEIAAMMGGGDEVKLEELS